MKWFAFYEDFNARCIKPLDIFKHYSFKKDCCEIAKKYGDDFDIFSEKVRISLQYYFWAKCEYEVIVGSLFDRKDFQAKKIDVYDQVMLNWDAFIKYVWENRKELLEP